jgi:hypothetical protein
VIWIKINLGGKERKKMKIISRFNGTILYEKKEATTMEACLVSAVSNGANLEGANLYGVNLRGANLEGVNLYGADLEGVNLEGANLYGADLYGAILEGANLEGANLIKADLRGANLYGVILYGANLYGVNLEGAENYSESHDIFIELVRTKIKIKEAKSTEWEIIGKITVHRPCWNTIKKFARKPMQRIFKRLADKGFGEFLAKYKEIIKKG